VAGSPTSIRVHEVNSYNTCLWMTEAEILLSPFDILYSVILLYDEDHMSLYTVQYMSHADKRPIIFLLLTTAEA
jgi:hypothetical protein